MYSMYVQYALYDIRHYSILLITYLTRCFEYVMYIQQYICNYDSDARFRFVITILITILINYGYDYFELYRGLCIRSLTIWTFNWFELQIIIGFIKENRQWK